MAEATVTLVLDAEQYYREIARATKATDGLGRSGSGLGEGFLRGERAVSRGTSSMVLGLTRATSAADALSIGLLGLERIAVVGLGAAVGLAIGIGLAEAFKRARDAAQALNDEIRKTISLESGPASYASLDKLQAKLVAIGEEQDKIIKRAKEEEANPLAGLARAISTHPTLTPGAAVATQRVEDERQSNELAQSLLDTQTKITQKIGEQADLLETNLNVSSQQAAMDKLQNDYLEKRAPLIREGATQNLQAVAQLDRLHALELEQLQRKQNLENLSAKHAQDIANIENKGLSTADERLQKLEKELEYRRQLSALARTQEEIQATTTAETQAATAVQKERQTQFQTFVGGGASTMIAQQQQAAFQKAQFESAQRDFQDRISRGAFGQSPLEQQLLGKPEPSAQDFTGINSLAGQDFSGLASLAAMNFDGLEPLNGLTITIQ